jgi:hypothetical protein
MPEQGFGGAAKHRRIAGEQADGVEALRQRKDTRDRDRAVGGTEPVQAAVRRRYPDRSERIGPDP